MKAILLKDLKDGWGPNGTVDGYIQHFSGSIVEALLWSKSTGGCYPTNQNIYMVGAFLVLEQDLKKIK